MENHKINVPNHQPVYAGHHLAPCVENPKRLGPNPEGSVATKLATAGRGSPGHHLMAEMIETFGVWHQTMANHWPNQC